MQKSEKRKLFGQRLKIARSKIGLTQVELAKKLGVHSGLVAVWEVGRSIPRPTALDALAAALNVPIAELTELTAADPADQLPESGGPTREVESAAKALGKHIRRHMESVIESAGTDLGKLGYIIHRLEQEWPKPASPEAVADALFAASAQRPARPAQARLRSDEDHRQGASGPQDSSGGQSEAIGDD